MERPKVWAQGGLVNRREPWRDLRSGLRGDAARPSPVLHRGVRAATHNLHTHVTRKEDFVYCTR